MTVSYQCKLNFFTFYLHITFIVCIFVVDKRGKDLQNTHKIKKIFNFKTYIRYERFYLEHTPLTFRQYGYNE